MYKDKNISHQTLQYYDCFFSLKFKDSIFVTFKIIRNEI